MKQAVVLRRVDAHSSSAEVEAGPMRMKVPLSDIVGVEEPSAIAPRPGMPNRGIRVQSQPTDEPSAEEINVIGSTVEQAIERVDKFIDSAAVANLPQVRIIHGHGTGALRRGLAEFLRTHPLVEQIHAEATDRGGTAITVVELKG
jgi:DNA mismatch repair protein MutS2